VIPEKDVRFAGSFAEAIDAVASKAEDGDMILTLGAGSVSQIGPMILEKLQSAAATTAGT
jgi:UDP-N-acetylmuramate--alanine ligase